MWWEKEEKRVWQKTDSNPVDCIIRYSPVHYSPTHTTTDAEKHFPTRWNEHDTSVFILDFFSWNLTTFFLKFNDFFLEI